MLRRLKISNYALIEQLDISFDADFTAITGETGAGKSILVGALGLVLGNRADTTVLHDKNEKCIVEASFDIKNREIRPFFTHNELDYDDECILRREINPNGKSRAFINDSPVNLLQMKELGSMLVDIHSQHDSLYLSDASFQLGLIDSMAMNAKIVAAYETLYYQFRQYTAELEQLKKEAEETKQMQEMLEFQYRELDQANLVPNEEEELHDKINELSHAEDIKTALYSTASALNLEEENVLQKIRDTQSALQRIAGVFPQAADFASRLNNHLIDIKDIAEEAEKALHRIQFEPEELERSNSRLITLQGLAKKYKCADIEELIQLRDTIELQLERIENSDLEIEIQEKKLRELEQKLKEKAFQLTKSRKDVIPATEGAISRMLQQLGMPNAVFKAQLTGLNHYTTSGTDSMEFLFSANIGSEAELISKVASGGELSRLMLSIKSLISSKNSIPTIIFDEIDTGVSGEVAARIGRIMASMGKGVQLIAITHLPQIASKAKQHFVVIKREDMKRARTLVLRLNENQRIDEIARMLSDDTITPAARSAAKELIMGF